MYFNIKRYFYGIIKRRILALLVFVIPSGFLVVSAILPDRYSVVQNVTVSETSPIALMNNPVGVISFKELNTDPAAFFLNSYALTKLSGTVLSGWTEKYRSIMDDMIKSSMTMVSLGENTVQIRYYGKSRELGEILVTFYADRLVKKAMEGLVRSNTSGPGMKPELSGSVGIHELRSLWRSDRTIPLVLCFIVSLILVSILFGFLEWSDPSFKSERQIARYIGLPILGSIPDLNKVAALIHPK